MYIFLILIIILFFWWNYKANYYQPKWSVLIMLCALMLAHQIYLLSNWQFAQFFFVLIASSIICGVYDYKKMHNPFIEMECSRTTVGLFACGILFLFADKNLIEATYQAIPIILTANALIKFIPYRFRQLTDMQGKTHTIYGVGGNKSTDSTMVSILAAMMLTHDYISPLKTMGLISAYIAIIDNHATAGALGLNLALAFWATTLGYPMITIAIVLISGTVLYKYRKTLLHDSGRLEMWQFIRKYLFKKKIFGYGNGSFKIIMPIAQTNLLKNAKNVSIWAHNDLLQLFVENGYIGVISMLLFLASIIPGLSLNNWVVFLAIIPNVVFNFSTHMAPDMFLMIIALKEYFLSK